MTRVQILLDDRQHAFLSSFAKRNGTNVSATVRQLVEEKMEHNLETNLRDAADDLFDLYKSNEELTSFIALDSEDWAE